MLYAVNINSIVIVTREGVEFSIPLAGTIIRFLAWLIDFFVILTSYFFLNKIISFISFINADLAQAIMIISYFIISIGYSIFTEWFWNGQTIGKKLFSLRVIDKNTGKIMFYQIVLRNLLRFVDMLPFFYLIGGTFNFFSKFNQRLGDIAANTIVIRQAKTIMPDVKQITEDKYNAFMKIPGFERRVKQKLSGNQIELAIESILRRKSLIPESRILIYKNIADDIDFILKTPPDIKSALTDEQYIRNIICCYFSK
ncbi:MAG TPA: RDD family protein [bacterium]|nr:RDD family protein [bacterium]